MYAVIKDRSGREAMVSYLDGDPTATLSSAFEQWIIPLSELAPVSLSSIESVTIGGAPSGALGTAYVDLLRMGTPLPVVVDPLYADYAADPFHEGSHEGSNDWGRNTAWFTRVCIGVTVRLICFRARAQRSGARNRNRERREADYEYDYECDSYVESCNPELNQARNTLGVALGCGRRIEGMRPHNQP